MTVLQWIKDNKLGKYRISGQEVEIGCPFKDCPNAGQPNFYINQKTESWFCHRCSKKGHNLKHLEFALGLISLKDPVSSTHIYIPEKEVLSWVDDLFNTPEALQYLKGRGFTEETIEVFSLGYKKLHDGEAISIPYFDKTGACVGVKYDYFKRLAGQSKYTKEKNSASILFNLDRVRQELPVIVTEGEYDAITLHQYGYANVVSIPNGCQGVNGWTEDIELIEKVILALDNDRAGQEGVTAISEALGRARCYRVFPRMKDWNECLQYGIEKAVVEGWFKDEKPMFKPPITNIEEYKDRAIEIINDPNKALGWDSGWDIFNHYLGGIREKEVTALTGRSGRGKSTLCVNAAVNLMDQGIRSLIASPEMPEDKLLIKLASCYYGQKATPEHITEFVDNHKDKIKIASLYGKWTGKEKEGLMDILFDLIHYSVIHFGIKFVVIDHIRLFLDITKDNVKAQTDEFMRKVIRLAMLDNIHVFLVAQPTKLSSGDEHASAKNMSGSASIEQDSHNNISVREGEPGFTEFVVEKCRETGKRGNFKMKFSEASMAHYEELEGE